MVSDKKTDLTRRGLRFLIVMVVFGAVFIVGYLILNGNAAQIYTDVVNEWTAIDSSNKSAERSLIYILSIAGSFAYVLYYFWSQHRHKGWDLSPENAGESETGYKTLLLIVIMMAGVFYLVYQGTAPILIASLICLLLAGMRDKSSAVPAMALLWLAQYAICAVYRIYVCLGGRNPLGMTSVAFWAVILTLVLLFHKGGKRVLFRGILLCQSVIPGLLLIYTASNYMKGDAVVSHHTPYKVWGLILLLIACFVAESVYRAYKNWDGGGPVARCISYGACVSIMAFNRFSGTGAIISNDMHHPYEGIIAYSQIAELGQKPFSEYIPVSGMYSIVQGAFFKFFGHGRMEYYSISANVMYLVVIMLIVALLMAQLRRDYVLLIAFIFTVTDYSRITFIVPIACLLSLPALIERKNLWLQAWFLTSFLHGLYYPVNGAAVCLAFMPLGVWQIITFCKTGELKKEVRKWRFWLGWAICLMPAIAGIPLLAGTLKHMLAMGGQTVYADGLSRFGSALPGNFFSYISSLSVRLALYYVFTFLILAGIVWVSVALSLKLGNVRIENRKLKADAPVPACLAVAIGIMLLVSFSYTIIRLDIGAIYSRSAGAAYAAFVMLILLIGKYMDDPAGGMRYARYAAIGFALFIITAVSGEAFKGNEWKLAAYYTVPESHVAITDDATGRFGNCYMDGETYEYVKSFYAKAESLDKEKSYLGILPSFGYYYVYGVKGASTIEPGTIKGYRAAEETVELLRRNDIGGVSSISPHSNYYLYHYLMASGEYRWNPQMGCFEKAGSDISAEQVLMDNQAADIQGNYYGIGRTAGSWGLSMESLSEIFTDPGIKYSLSSSQGVREVVFDAPLDGDDADFMYIEFADMDRNYEYILFDHKNDTIQKEDPLANPLMKKDYNRGMTVAVSWTGDGGEVDTMECSMCQGKLLIPIGAGRDWLLHEHEKLEVSVLQDGEKIEMPEIREVRFLKLREIS